MFDDATIQKAVHAYVLSVPLLGEEDELVKLVGANEVDFCEGGEIIQCMQAIGTALASGAAAYKGPPVQNKFLGMMPAGLANLPGRLDAQMRSQGIAVGQEFLWLASVLPRVAVGDYAPYLATATPTRQQLVSWIHMISQMNPALLQTMVAQMRLGQPLIEQAILDLARQVNV